MTVFHTEDDYEKTKQSKVGIFLVVLKWTIKYTRSSALTLISHYKLTE